MVRLWDSSYYSDKNDLQIEKKSENCIEKYKKEVDKTTSKTSFLTQLEIDYVIKMRQKSHIYQNLKWELKGQDAKNGYQCICVKK